MSGYPAYSVSDGGHVTVAYSQGPREFETVAEAIVWGDELLRANRGKGSLLGICLAREILNTLLPSAREADRCGYVPYKDGWKAPWAGGA